MTDFWVSKNRYWCKYCSIFIADDKPSRIHHETGLKHKGNYERYIRDIYKRGEIDKREKKAEQDEITRIEEAARKAMKQDGVDLTDDSTSSTPQLSSKPTASTSKDPFASYTTAADLGFTEKVDPEAERLRLEKETRENEGLIGQWEVVKKRPKSTTTSSSTSAALPPPPQWMMRAGFQVPEEAKPKLEPDQSAIDEQGEEPVLKKPKYFLEKALPTEADDEYDPSKVGPVKLRKKVTTLREEQDMRLREAETKRINMEALEEKRRREAEDGDGWRHVELTGDEQLLEFDEPPPRTDDEDQKLGDPAATDDDAKPTIGGGFKKRKMHGANAIRKK